MRLKGRLALVTGASRGLGAAVARRYAAEGADLILVARNPKALEKIDDDIRKLGRKATLATLDLRQFDRIDAMAASLQQRFGKLDVLASCAGVLGHLAPLGHFDPRLWQEVIETNFIANWRLIRALEPLLRQSDAGRAIFTSCAAARDGEPYWGAYGASKAALEAMVKIYASEIAQTTLRANLIDPGPLATELRAAGFPFEDRATLKSPDEATEAFVALAEATCMSNGALITA